MSNFSRRMVASSAPMSRTSLVQRSSEALPRLDLRRASEKLLVMDAATAPTPSSTSTRMPWISSTPSSAGTASPTIATISEVANPVHLNTTPYSSEQAGEPNKNR